MANITSGSQKPTILLLAFVIIGVIIDETNAKPPARIVNGKDAKYRHYGWMVTLTVPGSQGNTCGGAIIGPRHILTAAHCIDYLTPETLIVRAGIVHLQDPNVIVSRASRLIVHPDYLSYIRGVRKTQNDIGIVVLRDELTLGGRLRAIGLPTREAGRERATFSGWGRISNRPLIRPLILKTADVQVLDEDECRSFALHGPQYICGYQENGYILKGDSGSPLVSGGEVIGVASSSWEKRRHPDFYTNVYHYLDWINSIVRQSTD